MALPSFKNGWRKDQSVKPRILVLEIKDKDRPDDKTLGWVFVEREETYRRDLQDGTIYEASIRLSYQRITAKVSHQDCGSFNGSYSRNFNSVSLTSASMSKGAVFLDLQGLRGQRVGTYLMNEIVQWVQQWPETTVNSIELLAEQTYGDNDNKARRNWFYEQFGLVFDYTDSEHRKGRSRPMLAGALVKVETWKKNITEHWMLDYLAKILDAEEQAKSKFKTRDGAYTQLIDKQRQAEARPVRWALRRLYILYADIVLAGLVLMALVVIAWIKMA